MITTHILNALPDIPRLYTAISEWLGCLVYLLAIGSRTSRLRMAAVLLPGLAVLVVVQYWAGTLPIAFWIISMCLAVAGRPHEGVQLPVQGGNQFSQDEGTGQQIGPIQRPQP